MVNSFITSPNSLWNRNPHLFCEYKIPHSKITKHDGTLLVFSSTLGRCLYGSSTGRSVSFSQYNVELTSMSLLNIDVAFTLTLSCICFKTHFVDILSHEYFKHMQHFFHNRHTFRFCIYCIFLFTVSQMYIINPVCSVYHSVELNYFSAVHLSSSASILWGHYRRYRTRISFVVLNKPRLIT